ncbi:MAG: peptide ABC transporter substrate-binding protein [Rhodospirillaceae bacterium]
MRALVLVLVLGLALGASGSARAGHDELRIGISQYPSTLHPAIDAMAAKTYVLAMTRRPMTAYDADWQRVCLLCTALPDRGAGTAADEPGGGMAVTYTIRPEAVWGDGVPVTTRDVLFTFEAGRHPLSGFDSHDLFTRDIKDITAIDDRRFTVHLARRTCDYQGLDGLELLPAHLERPVFEADPAAYTNRTLYRTDPTNPGLYFGPYRITAVDTGSRIELEANPRWWGAPPPFKRVVVRAVENSAALEAGLLAGDLDLVPGEIGLPLDQVLALDKRQDGRFEILTRAGLFFEHVDVRLDTPALADVRVRRALLQAIDRETISRQLFAGRQPVADDIVSPLDRMFDPAVPRYRYDPGAANRLLDEAGWTGRRGGIRTNAAGETLQLSLASTAGNRSRELVEQVLQAQWRQVGVEVRIENQPARVLFGQTLRERGFTGLALFAWISAPGSIPRGILHSSMIPSAANGFSGQNYSGLSDPDLDRTLDDLEVVCEPAANRALWAKLQRRYAEQLPSLPLYYRAEATVKPKWLTGIVPTGHMEPTTLWIENWRVAP